MAILGPLISAGASLLGGLFGRSSQDKANAQNIQLQKDFAQQGIRWKVADAKAAGIHPLYALGAQTHSFSPSLVGDTSLPTGLANAGQDISRAIDAGRTPTERVDAYARTVQALNLTRLGLENDLLASQIRKINQAGHPPGLPDVVDVAGNPRTAASALGGYTAGTTPMVSDAQVFQQRYGEPGDWLGGVHAGVADIGAGIGRWFRSVGLRPTRPHRSPVTWK